jgi:hypothetical protein
MLALPTIRNTPGTDLVVTSVDGRRHASIQVKTTQNPKMTFWAICTAKKFTELPFGEYDYYLLLRPRRAGDPSPPDSDDFNELEGFMLTAQEAKKEMKAHLDYKTQYGKEIKFPLCIWVDKGKREKSWPEAGRGKWEQNRAAWRQRWRTWRL